MKRSQTQNPRRRITPSLVWPGRLVATTCLGIVVAFLVADMVVRSAELNRITAVKTTDLPVETTPVSPGARIHHDILAVTSMDGRWWIIDAEDSLRDGRWRVRETKLDNAPSGREVHWSSSLIWLLGAIASVISRLTGQSPAVAVAQAAFWVGPVQLVFLLALLGWLAAKRYGLGPASIFVAVFALWPLIYQCFRPGEADHHGLVCALAAASVLCLAAGGAGLVRPPGRKASSESFPFVSLDAARRWFLGSGILGGAALWVSAASAIPILGGCAFGGAMAFFLRDRENSRPASDLWRIWAGAGCISSLFFYAIEYFPDHLGWRLEVNHPVFAFAWLGGGDLLARILTKAGGRAAFSRGGRSYLAAGASLAAVLIPPILVAFRPHEVFQVSDKFLLLLHNEFILEFKSFARLLADSSPLAVVLEAFTWPLLVVLGGTWLFWRGRISRSWLPVLAFALVSALIVQGLALWQIRWCILSSGLWTVSLLVVLAAYAHREGRGSRVFVTGLIVAGAITLIGQPLSTAAALFQLGILDRNLPKAYIPSIIARDVAHRLVQSSPGRLPVVLSGPTTSTDLTYFAGIKTIGTLYWENLEGLKRAAAIFAAPDADRARSLIEQAGITHIVVSTWDNFGRAYVGLLRDSGVPTPPEGDAFIERLLRENLPPDWLRPLYYPIPAGFDIHEELRIYAVVPYQTPAEALLHRGIYALEAGDSAGAEGLFDQGLKADPHNGQLQLLKEEARRLKSMSKTQKETDDSASPNAK